MLPSSKVVKDTARISLKGRWAPSIAVVSIFICAFLFLTILLSFIFSFLQNATLSGTFLSLFTAIISWLIMVPLAMGGVRWFWFSAIDKEIAVSEVFYYYSSPQLLARSVYFVAQFFLRTVFYAIFCFLPLSIMEVLQDSSFYEALELESGMPMILPVLWPLEYLFLIAGVVLLLFATAKYSLAPVAFVMAEEIPVSDTFSISVSVLKGNASYCVGMMFSFIGWIILSFSGVALIYTAPFILMSYCTFARFSISNHRITCAKMGIKSVI